MSNDLNDDKLKPSISSPEEPVKRFSTFLDVVDACDNVRVHKPSPVPSIYNDEILIPLYLTAWQDSPVIGLLRPIVIQQLIKENKRSRDLGKPLVWNLVLDPQEQIPRYDRRRAVGPSVCLHNWINSHQKRTEIFKELCERWRDTGVFEDVCGPRKWRDELYPVYANPFGAHDHPTHNTTMLSDRLNFVFELERSACAIFGIATYGVHMNIYKETVEDGRKTIHVWVPTRARTKQTFPGMLDNSVAGGIPSGMSALESIIKECMEEASIEDHVARKYTVATGAISYFFRTARGWLQPEVQYTYDIHIPLDADPALFQPKPLDGEVESFELMTHDVIIEKMLLGLFKPNCALVLIDLFVRRGYITPDNELDYMEIVTRLHGKFDFELW